MPVLTKAVRQYTKRLLVYGPPKVGKSQLVSELAKDHKLLWFDLEKGSDVLYKLPESAQENIMLIQIPDSKTNPIAIETMLKVVKRAKGKICAAHGKFGCPLCIKDPNALFDEIDMTEQNQTNKYIVVVDSMTQLRSSAINYIAKGKPDDYKFQHDDWAKLGALMDGFLSEVQAANYDVIVISHEELIETTDGKEKIVAAAGTRNFSRNSAKYFSDVIYCEVANNKHKFASSTVYKPLIQTGSRSDIELEKMDKPSLFPFFEHRSK